MFCKTNLFRFFLLLLLNTSLILWWACAPKYETDIILPIDYSSLSDRLILTNRPLKGIEVHLSGSKSIADTISDLNLTYSPVLTDMSVGTISIKIKPELISLPKGLDVKSINPTYLILHIENKIKKQIPIKVAISGKPAPGFLIGDMITEPESVILYGPQTLLSNINIISTLPVDLSGHSETFKKEIPLSIPEGTYLSGKKKISANISVKENIIIKKFNKISVKGKNRILAYNIFPETIKLELKGPVNTLEKLNDNTGFDIYIDLINLKHGKYMKHASIILPSGVTLAGVSPEFFTVTIFTRRAINK